MKAIRVHAPGGPEVLRYEDVPEPQPKAGEAVVRVEAAGLNFIDVYNRTGLYKVALPFTLGREGAGTVLSVGRGREGRRRGRPRRVGGRRRRLRRTGRGSRGAPGEAARRRRHAAGRRGDAAGHDRALPRVHGVSAEAGRRLPRPRGGRGRGPAADADREDARGARDRHGLDARRRRSSPARRAPTRRSTTRGRTSSPR